MNKKMTIVPIIIFILLIIAAPVYAAQYQYDDLNRLTDVIYDSGKRIHYTYDAAGNMLGMVVTTASPEVKGITTDSVSYTLKVGETQKTVVSAVYADDTASIISEGITFTSSNDSVASVDFAGTVKGLKAGKTEITVVYNGKTAIIKVEVLQTEMPVKGYIDSPINNATVKDKYNVIGWVLDLNGVSKVEILIDSNVVGQAVYGDSRKDVAKVYPDYRNDNSGFHYSLDTKKLTEGKHTMTVIETGSTGLSTTIGTKVINVYNMLPRGYIDTPKNNSPVSGVYRIKGWFLDNSGVNKIEVLVDDEVIGEAVYGTLRADVITVYPQYNNKNCGYYFDLDTTKMNEGTHIIKIRETGKNTAVTSIERRFIVSRLPVKGYVQNIGSINHDRGIVNINGWLLDSSGVSKIEIVVDGTVIGEASYGDPSPEVFSKYPEYANENAGFHYVLDTSKLSKGEHIVKILETGKNGGQTELPMIFGCLDTPKGEKPISGIARISGWILDSSGVGKIEVMIDDIVVGQATYGDSRLDVYKAYPNFDNKNSGFHYDLSTSKLSEGTHTIKIINHSQSGEVKYLGERQITVAR